MAPIELESKRTTERDAGHMWSPKTERVDELSEAVGAVGKAERFGRIR
jgi:hypothetical protein